MTSITSLLFLITLFLFALLDVHKYYSFRLLSENLAIFTIAGFFFCLFKGMEKNNKLLQIAAPIFLGLSILIRPNIFPFAIAICLVLLFYFRNIRLSFTLQFILLLVFSSSFLAIRNYVACGSFAFLPTVGNTFGNDLLHHFTISPAYFLKKILFIMGFLSTLNPEYQWRPHWILMWAGYLSYLYFRLKEKRKFELWETTSHLYIFFFYGLLLIIAPQLGSYGFRLLIPATFIVLPFSFITIDILYKKYFLNN